jgi:selenide,water dikinase
LRYVRTETSDPAVLVGLASPDDAAVYQVAPGVAIVQTVDFFTPVVDEPVAWGRIAAANALSDVYAMGAQPVTALNLIGWPRALGFDLLGKVIEGANDACEEAGVSIVGGHSVDDPEPKFGLAVTGVVDPERVIRTSGARPRCELILTKPLGMGLISSGIKEGKTSEGSAQLAAHIMGTLNKAAAEAMVEFDATAATDVTGFGLVGHLLEMLNGSTSAVLDFDRIPVLQEAFELAEQGVYAGGSKRNLESMRDKVHAEGLSDAESKVLFDAQTSGGLLIAVEPQFSMPLFQSLHSRGVRDAAVIGRIVEGDGTIEVTR